MQTKYDNPQIPGLCALHVTNAADVDGTSPDARWEAIEKLEYTAHAKPNKSSMLAQNASKRQNRFDLAVSTGAVAFPHPLAH